MLAAMETETNPVPEPFSTVPEEVPNEIRCREHDGRHYEEAEGPPATSEQVLCGRGAGRGTRVSSNAHGASFRISQ